MKMKLVFCEGLRDSRFVQSVIEFYLKFKPITEDEAKTVKRELEKLIKRLIGRIEGIYKSHERYVIVVNMQSKIFKLLKDKSLLEAYKDLEEYADVVFVIDMEHAELQRHFKSCLIFNERIEDLIMRIANNLKLTLENDVVESLIDICQKYTNKIDRDKFRVQLYHLILSAGECDKKMFATMFKLLKDTKPDEVVKLIELLS